MVMLNRFDVYPVILLVGTNESDEYDPARVVFASMNNNLQIDGISTRPAENHRPFSFNPTPAWCRLIKG